MMRAETAAQVLWRYQNRSQSKSFTEYAEAGLVFLAGLDELEHLIAVAEQEGFPELARTKATKTAVNRDFVRRILSYCALMESVDERFDRINAPPPGGNAAKPHLHMAVRMIRDLWLDLTRGTHRTKKDFLSFAYDCLKPTGCVTETAILESLDRRVRGRRKDRYEADRSDSAPNCPLIPRVPVNYLRAARNTEAALATDLSERVGRQPAAAKV